MFTCHWQQANRKLGIMDTHHPSVCSFVDGCNFATRAGHSGFLNPILKATFYSSIHPNDGQFRGLVLSNKRKHKMTERQRHKDMNSLISILKFLLPVENLHVCIYLTEQKSFLHQRCQQYYVGFYFHGSYLSWKHAVSDQ